LFIPVQNLSFKNIVLFLNFMLFFIRIYFIILYWMHKKIANRTITMNFWVSSISNTYSLLKLKSASTVIILNDSNEAENRFYSNNVCKTKRTVKLFLKLNEIK
jgi:hypothetical protein